MHNVLVVDDDKILQDSLQKALQYQHFAVDVASSGDEAISKAAQTEYDLVVMDVNMPGMSGIDALVELKRMNPAIIVLILTAYSNVQDAVRAVKEGAYNYLEKPIKSEDLVALIKRALKARVMVETMAFSAPRLKLGKESTSDQFVGRSTAMRRVFLIIDKLAKVNTPVLIRGESGTGKELVAKAIHFNGPRKDHKIVTINCAAIPENLIESELFGHEKGAFTGANERKLGKFQYANGGTLFLDEIGDITPAMQVKLLRVLQDNTFTPVGSNREVKVDVRVVAASNKNFEKMIEDNEFREDLFYRLNVLPVYLPPLRDRLSDVPILANYYIKYFNELHGFHITGMTNEVSEIFQTYHWPGNIRELRNVIEHAFIMESDEIIHVTSLPDDLLNKIDKKKISDISNESIIDFDGIQSSVFDNDNIENQFTSLDSYLKTMANEEEGLDFQLAKDLFEKEFIKMALKINNGKINQTALKANIPKKTLLRKIEKYQINPKEFY